jgi:hypothetical protein
MTEGAAASRRAEMAKVLWESVRLNYPALDDVTMRTQKFWWLTVADAALVYMDAALARARVEERERWQGLLAGLFSTVERRGDNWMMSSRTSDAFTDLADALRAGAPAATP